MDFYVVLGVAQNASAAEIKRAYRRLSRRYHPGINPGDRAAEEMFRRISEAYDTLIDPARRQEYDRAGQPAPANVEDSSFEFTEFDFSVAAHGAHAATFTELFADVLHPVAGMERNRSEPGADLHAALTIGFIEALRGVDRQVVVTRQVPCGMCAGDGQVPVPEGRCPQCRGTGKTRWARGHMVFSKSCAACGGAGRQRFQRCAACTGYGRAVRSEAVMVHVPPGMADGARVRVPERGHAGRYGGRTGDLYVTVHVQPHAWLRRDGDDLVCTVPVAVHEAVLGARIDVPLIDGPVRLRILPGTQSGQRIRLRERGAPTAHGGRGDLVVEVKLVLPSALDERSKELMREFGQRNGGNVREQLWSAGGGA